MFAPAQPLWRSFLRRARAHRRWFLLSRARPIAYNPRLFMVVGRADA
jgi:hypothetical protein